MVGLEQQPLLERHLQPLVHRLEGEAHGQGAHREYTPQRFLRRGQQLRARHHLVHEADPVRFVGVDHVARQNEVQGVPFAHETRQALRAAVAGCDAELHLRLAELCGLTRDPQMARHGELAAAAQGVAVHGGDDRLAAGFEAAQHRLAAQRPGLAVEWALLREIRDVGAGDERLGAGAREEGTPDRRARITTDWPATASTLATVESLTDQVTGRPERMFPPASRSVAKNLAVSPAATTAVSGVTETVATESLGGGGGAESVTLSCAEPLLPSLVAVMSATPAPVVRITTV